MNSNEVREYVEGLTALARQLNTFASGLKTVRKEMSTKKPTGVRESTSEYNTAISEQLPEPLFSEEDLILLTS